MGVAVAMDDVFAVQCPYCGEVVEIYLEPDVRGTLVQDCEVCCNPIQVIVTRDRDGDVDVRVERAQ
jgi:predicted DCC family thiol-disulfide oxidoreductase YuxK